MWAQSSFAVPNEFAMTEGPQPSNPTHVAIRVSHAGKGTSALAERPGEVVDAPLGFVLRLWI